MLPVLIVCYLRPEKLKTLLESLKESNRRIFIFIDRANDPFVDLNAQVFNVATEYVNEMDLVIKWADTNQGVAHGVPAAMNWAFSHVDELIIIEDDCLPTQFAYEFFENQKAHLFGTSQMLCATSPWLSDISKENRTPLTLSSYPLIWGWCTTAKNWQSLSKLINAKTPHMRVAKTLFKYPSRIREVCFFYSAVIRVNRGKLKAWDCPVALEMLLNDYKSIISNRNLVENSGQDGIASHFSNSESLLEEIVSKAQSGPASSVLDSSREWSQRVDLAIEENVYQLKWRHIFSPLKAMIGF